ncbi:MAG: hypothetical protein EBQ92_01000 [Proteobacteria bacterium]|nr:hypothetical protein [Pseudomonadota bacterium]
MPVPFVFGNATTSIPLSNLDANFNTTATLGNAAIGLGNTTTTVGNLTLTNVTLSSGTSNMTLGNTAVTIGSATTSVGNLALTNVTITTIQEPSNVTATAANATINMDLLNNSVLYLTSNAAGNFTINFRGSSTTSLNTMMSNNTSVSCTVLTTQGATAYYNSALQVDGSSVTPRWQGGTAPTSGNASGIDSYTYVIIKTGSAAFTVLAAQTQFKA